MKRVNFDKTTFKGFAFDPTCIYIGDLNARANENAFIWEHLNAGKKGLNVF